MSHPTPTTTDTHLYNQEPAVTAHTTATRPAAARVPRGNPSAAIPDAPWTNTDLLAYFKCGPTKLADIKKDPAFPPAVLVCGLQRYDPAAIRAFFHAKQTTPTTTLEGTQP